MKYLSGKNGMKVALLTSLLLILLYTSTILAFDAGIQAYAQSSDLEVTAYPELKAVQIKNGFDYPIDLWTVNLDYYRTNDEYVGSAEPVSAIRHLSPGQQVAVPVYYLPDTDIVVTWKNAKVQPPVLEVNVDDSYLSDQGIYHIKGKVTNRGDETAHNVIVSATLYDSKEEPAIIGSSRIGYTDARNNWFYNFAQIPSGETKEFELKLPNAENIKSFTIDLQSDEYSMMRDTVTSISNYSFDEYNSVNHFKALVSYGEIQYSIIGKTPTWFEVYGFTIDPERSVIMNVNDKDDRSNNIELKIPKAMIDGINSVQSNSTALSFEVAKDDSSTTIRFSTSQEDKILEIHGATVVPEFGLLAGMIMGISISGLVLWFRSTENRRS